MFLLFDKILVPHTCFLSVISIIEMAVNYKCFYSGGKNVSCSFYDGNSRPCLAKIAFSRRSPIQKLIMTAIALTYSGHKTSNLFVVVVDVVFVVVETLGWPLTIAATVKNATRPVESVA